MGSNKWDPQFTLNYYARNIPPSGRIRPVVLINDGPLFTLHTDLEVLDEVEITLLKAAMKDSATFKRDVHAFLKKWTKLRGIGTLRSNVKSGGIANVGNWRFGVIDPNPNVPADKTWLEIRLVVDLDEVVPTSDAKRADVEKAIGGTKQDVLDAIAIIADTTHLGHSKHHAKYPFAGDVLEDAFP